MILSNDIYSEVLHTISTPVLKSEWVSLKKSVPFMKELTDAANGVGLAAPQIGILKNFFIFKTSINHYELVINPEIIRRSSETIEVEEGCLSCPDIQVKMKRNKEIKVSYFNSLWTLKTKTLRGSDAIIFQHEFDHLKGKLISDNLQGE